MYPKGTKPILTICVSTKNRNDEFKKCIESVHKHTHIPFELIIVDAGSTDGTRNELKTATFKQNSTLLLEAPVPGYAQGNNLAMKMAKGDYIYLLNNDNWVTENWIEPMIALYKKDKTIGHMSSLMLWPDDKVQSAGALITRDGASISILEGKHSKNVMMDKIIECDYAGFGLYRKDVLERVNYLDERYFPIYFDDTDYGLKVKNLNYSVNHYRANDNPNLSGKKIEVKYKVVCLTTSRVYHKCSDTERGRWQENNAIVATTNYS